MTNNSIFDQLGFYFDTVTMLSNDPSAKKIDWRKAISLTPETPFLEDYEDS